LPTDLDDAHEALREAWRRAALERVEIACGGGRGRTGTALACIAVLDGVPPAQAVAYVREHYDPRAVETPWQRKYVARFPCS
jgi:protein-tyrosine phosphatase